MGLTTSDYSIIINTGIKKKTNNSNIILKFKDYNIVQNNNFSVNTLKNMCKFYKIKQSGNKSELISRVYNFLFNSHYANIIQKNYKRYIAIKFYKLLGPGLYKRHLCKNDSDFFTLENLSVLNDNEFYSFKENDNIWGFNIKSIYNLFIKNKTTNVLNPFTREKIPIEVFQDIKSIIKLAKCMNKIINIDLDKTDNGITPKKMNEIKAFELFQIINTLGNYADHNWFLSLNRIQLIRFIREIIDIWEYRADLTLETKQLICSPYGNPFRYLDVIHINNLGIVQLQKLCLNIIRQFITKGLNQEYSTLGANYVLCSLTLVSNEAANALPWLYQSVAN